MRQNTEVRELEQRVSDLKAGRDAALATGQNAKAADLNETLVLEERMLEEQRFLATSKKPLSVLAGDSVPAETAYAAE
jgi:hypothetical protein